MVLVQERYRALGLARSQVHVAERGGEVLVTGEPLDSERRSTAHGEVRADRTPVRGALLVCAAFARGRGAPPVDYSRPVASGPDEPASPGGRLLAPNVRLSLQVGGVMTPRASNWDLFVVYSVVDRGDLARPETTLPILDGGFDQQQLAIGVQHRSGVKESEE